MFCDLLLTSSRGSQTSLSLWDHTTGNCLHTYKNGGTVAPKCLNLIHYDYIITSDEDKPMTHVWPLNSQECDKKLATILPEKAQVMTVCPHNEYLAAGIGARLFIWGLSSGCLFSVQKKHFQKVSAIAFSKCGEFLVAGGLDGMVVVYKVNELLSLQSEIVPFFTKNDHSLPVTDLHIGTFTHPRLATVSSDNTCKLYNLTSGELLLNLVFQEGITSVIFDNPCFNLYTGLTSGLIQQFHSKNPPRNVHHHQLTKELIFQGHSSLVTCLDLSSNNQYLVSGSDDTFVFIWGLSSRQILRKLEHHGGITNVRFVLKHDHFFVQHLKPKSFVKALQRDLSGSDAYDVSVLQNYDVEDDDIVEKTVTNGSDDLREENVKLRAVNKELYDVAMGILKKYNCSK